MTKLKLCAGLLVALACVCAAPLPTPLQSIKFTGNIHTTGRVSAGSEFGFFPSNTITVHDAEGKSFLLNGVTVVFPSTDNAIFGCVSGTLAYTCGQTPLTTTFLTFERDSSSQINDTILIQLFSHEISLTSGQSLTFQFSFWMNDTAENDLRINGTTCTSGSYGCPGGSTSNDCVNTASGGGAPNPCVTGTGMITATQAVCTVVSPLSSWVPPGPCDPSSPNYVKAYSQVATCMTGLHMCPITAPDPGVTTFGVWYYTTLTLAMSAGSSGTIQVTGFGIHLIQ